MKFSKRLTSGARDALVVAAVSTFFSLSMLSAPALAYDENSKAAINVDAQGVALRGYDPVAYFTAGQPTVGDAKFSVQHEGATYRFASAENKDKFAAAPAKYIPAYGGFCAMGTAFGKKIDGDPTLWKVVDGKLFLNVNPQVQTRWLQDVPGNVAKASGEWPKIKDKAPKEL